MPSRIGELVVLGDENTAFGRLESEVIDLPIECRSHGSLAEVNVPLIIYNAAGAPHTEFFRSKLI